MFQCLVCVNERFSDMRGGSLYSVCETYITKEQISEPNCSSEAKNDIIHTTLKLHLMRRKPKNYSTQQSDILQ